MRPCRIEIVYARPRFPMHTKHTHNSTTHANTHKPIPLLQQQTYTIQPKGSEISCDRFSRARCLVTKLLCCYKAGGGAAHAVCEMACVYVSTERERMLIWKFLLYTTIYNTVHTLLTHSLTHRGTHRLGHRVESRELSSRWRTREIFSLCACVCVK